MAVDPFALNLRHLRAIAAIVTHGSMSAAAQAVSLSQPALTQGLAKLERQLGVSLFKRFPDGVRPTSAGFVLADRATAALNHLAKAARGLARGGGRGFARSDLLMTGTQLHAFLNLADAGSFTAASAWTGITQPAIHRAVRDLEQICGVPLSERLGRGITITPAGLKLARGIRLAAAEITAAIGELSLDPGIGSRIAVGAMPLSRALLVPRAVAALVRDGPRVTIEIREGSWRELVELLRDGSIDLTVGALRDPPPAGLRQEALFDDQLIVVGRAGHPLAGSPAPTLDDLARFSWIIAHPETPLRQHWQRLFEGRASPSAPIECGSVMVIRGLLRQSDFLTLLSRDQVGLEIERRMLTQISALPSHGERTIGITTREDWRPTAVQARLIELLRNESRERTLQEIE